MRKRKILMGVTSAVLVTSMLAAPAYALSWKDGVQKSWSFTYAGGTGVASVRVHDTNDTVNTTMDVGDTVVSKTGTIVWRNSYTNVTTFTVDAKTGYEITGVLENGREGDFTTTDTGIQFSFTRKGAEIAGAAGKNVTFSIESQAKEYMLIYDEPTVGEVEVGTCHTGQDIYYTIGGKKHVGWEFNGKKVDYLTEEMAAYGDAHNGVIYIDPIFE